MADFKYGMLQTLLVIEAAACHPCQQPKLAPTCLLNMEQFHILLSTFCRKEYSHIKLQHVMWSYFLPTFLSEL